MLLGRRAPATLPNVGGQPPPEAGASMASQQFSLAVVKGSGAGTSIQSARSRISIGSADDNDLILTDPGIALHHFAVLVDGQRWRVSLQTGASAVNVDRRWSHPQNGRRGALIQVAAVQLILYPGHLDKRTIELEILRRQEELADDALPTALNLPRMRVDEEPPLAATAPVIPAHVDDETMAQMDTIAAARPPEDLRTTAQEKLQGERRPPGSLEAPCYDRHAGTKSTPDAMLSSAQFGLGDGDGTIESDAVLPESQTRPENRAKTSGRKRSAWDKAKKPARADASLPEVLATPESQMMRVPDEATQPRPLRPEIAGPPPPRDNDPESTTLPQRPATPKNAWGEMRQSRSNAWGDPKSRALVAAAERRSNAWGDQEKRAVATSADAWNARGSAAKPTRDLRAESVHRRRDDRRETLRGVRHKLSLDVLRRRPDPSLQVLRVPDGPMATSVRLLGARVEEFNKNLGHRAYMITSPEPLTGKTTAALNLALALAEDTNRRVALVEANFRYPRFAEILGVDDRLGLLPVIDGRSRLGDSAIKVADRNLLLVPSGGRHRHPAEVLASPRFKSLMSELVEAVDVALVDAPSVRPFADTNLLLPLVDAAFIVVSQALTRRAWLSRALNQLGRKRVLGSLFNKIPQEEHLMLQRERKARLRE